jgi:hypothetical protein
MTPDEVIHILDGGEYPGYYDEVAAVDCIKNLVKEIEQLNFVLKNLVLATNKKINELEEEIENQKSKVQYWKGLHR